MLTTRSSENVAQHLICDLKTGQASRLGLFWLAIREESLLDESQSPGVFKREMDFPLIALWISSVLSVIAIIIAALSLQNSRRAQRTSENAQHHTQIVSFEQRKQEFRQVFLEENLLVIQIDAELKRFPDNEWRREKFSQLTASQNLKETVIKDFDRIPSSPATEARLKLEDLGGKIMVSNNGLKTLLKLLQDTNRSR